MVTWCPTKKLGPIGSAVLTFIGYKTNRQAKFIHTRLLERFVPIFYFICENVLFVYIVKQDKTKVRGSHKKNCGFSKIFKIWWKSNFVGGKFLKFWSFINLPWGQERFHTKLGLIGSAVLTFIGYERTDRHPNEQSI